MRLATRRTLLSSMAALPCCRPGMSQGIAGANDRIRVGVIGTGNRGNLLIDQLPARAEIAAVADCNGRRAEETASKRKARWKIHRDYRHLLDDKDIDAVIVYSPSAARRCPTLAGLTGRDAPSPDAG